PKDVITDQAKFNVGDRIIHLPVGVDYNVSRRRFTVVQVMPRDHHGTHYKVRCDRDAHEKVLHEHQMMRALGARSRPSRLPTHLVHATDLGAAAE
ncbi:MAG: hypothetical protein INR71_02925, partial [Terriglobus roseus]|nr:hypothetical protein [Terriglobus roseus]